MKKGILLLILALCLLSGCEKEEIQVESLDCAATEACFLCGSGSGESYWGQNNIGIISLNTFAVFPLEINRYDGEGTLIEENTGCASLRSFQNGEEGFYVQVLEDTGRGYALGTVTLYQDEVLDAEKAVAFLCQGCMDTLFSESLTKKFGVGMIDFATGKITLLEEKVTGFGLGDHYIHCGWKETKDSKGVNIGVFYCPPRYSEEE